MIQSSAHHPAHPVAALERVFIVRRMQAAFRMGITAVMAFSFGPILGWRITLSVLGLYAALQLGEWFGFGRPQGNRNRQGLMAVAPGLILLALNSFAFGLPSIWLVRDLGAWGVACAAYLLTGSIINCVQLTLGSRLAFFASVGPFFIYTVLIPLQARLVDQAISSTVLLGMVTGAIMLAAAVTRQWLQWDASRAKEEAAARAQQTERDVNESRLLKLAQQDALTGLGNRHVLQHSLRATLAEDQPGALFIVDLDDFKGINDMRGHGVGDDVLREIAKRIAGGCRRADTVTRLGGDEFAIVLPGLEADSVPTVASTLLERIGKRLPLNDVSLSIGASIGVALFPDHGRDVGQLLANADLALYQAKADGRNCHRIYQGAMRERAQEKLQLEVQLQQAVQRDEFELYYQPQIRLVDGTIIGAEALLRWNHPERGVLVPDDFLGALEASIMAPRVGQWILKTACAQAALWRQQAMPDFRMAVNLFGAQVRSPALLGNVRGACAQSGLPLSALELEITENIILGEEDEIIGSLRALRDMGVGLAFDDFGTGFASLSLLKHYPVSKLKIDRLFISEICESHEDAVIVFGLVDMAVALGINVLAEGVETQAQATLLARHGCVEAQGYAIGRPVPAAAFQRSWLTAAGTAAMTGLFQS